MAAPTWLNTRSDIAAARYVLSRGAKAVRRVALPVTSSPPVKAFIKN